MIKKRNQAWKRRRKAFGTSSKLVLIFGNTFTQQAWTPATTSNAPTWDWMLATLAQLNSNSFSCTFALLRYMRNPSSCGCKSRRAFPLPPSPRAVRPTRWMYSCQQWRGEQKNHHYLRLYFGSQLFSFGCVCCSQVFEFSFLSLWASHTEW